MFETNNIEIRGSEAEKSWCVHLSEFLIANHLEMSVLLEEGAQDVHRGGRSPGSLELCGVLGSLPEPWPRLCRSQDLVAAVVAFRASDLLV